MNRQKVCPHCKGRVPAESSECLYCTADLSFDGKTREETLASYQSFEESLSTLYTPQYATPNSASHGDTTAALASLYPGYELPPSTAETAARSAPMGAVEAEAIPQGNKSFASILLLSLGANFLCIGLMMLLLGRDGVLSLSWKTTYWPLYCLLGLPLTYFGWRVLRRID